MRHSTDPLVSLLRALRLARRPVARSLTDEANHAVYASAVGTRLAQIVRELERARDRLVQQAAYARHARARARATRAAVTRRQRGGAA